jgi:hypothetical protein
LDIYSTLVMWLAWIFKFYYYLVKLVYLEHHTPCGMNFCNSVLK